MKTPIIIINFKTYKESTGDNAVKLAKQIEKAVKKTKANVAIAVQAVDIEKVVKSVDLPVLAQHVDPDDFGGHTGKVLIDSVKKAGAIGTLLNHSEFKLSKSVITKTIKHCKDKNFEVVLCVPDSDKAGSYAYYSPDLIAVEPPELIGGGVSVTTKDPSIIKHTVEKVYKVRRIPVLCGAGIHEEVDVSKSLELGAKGVLVASGVVKNKDPYSETLSLIRGLSVLNV